MGGYAVAEQGLSRGPGTMAAAAAEGGRTGPAANGRTSANRLCSANHKARLRITPTTAAVSAVKAAFSA